MSASTSLPFDYDQPSLLLYSLDQAIAHNMEMPGSHLLRFLFPTSPTRGHCIISLTSDPSPIWPTGSDVRVPFQLSRDERTIAFRLFRGAPRSETFLMPSSAFLRHMSHIRDTEIEHDIRWESWSPAATVVPLQGRWTVYTCFVFGKRYILPKAARRDDRRVMIVRDLCPRRYMRASEEEREESNALYKAMGAKEPYPHSIVKSVPLPRSFKDISDTDLMISEDGIVALEVCLTKTMHLYGCATNAIGAAGGSYHWRETGSSAHILTRERDLMTLWADHYISNLVGYFARSDWLEFHNRIGLYSGLPAV